MKLHRMSFFIFQCDDDLTKFLFYIRTTNCGCVNSGYTHTFSPFLFIVVKCSIYISNAHLNHNSVAKNALFRLIRTEDKVRRRY